MDPNLQALLDQIAAKTGNDAQSKGALAEFTKAISSIVNKNMLADAKGILQNALSEISVDGSASAMMSIAAKTTKWLGDALTSGVSHMFGAIKNTVVREAAEAFGPDALFGNMNVGKLDATQAGIIKTFQSLRTEIQDNLDDSLVLNFAADKGIGAALESGIFKSLETVDKALTDQYMDYQKIGVGLTRALTAPFATAKDLTGQTATASAGEFRKKLMEGTSDLQVHFSVDDAEAKASLTSIAKEFFDMQRQVEKGTFEIKVKTASGTSTLDTMTSIALLAKGLNKDAASVAKYVNDMTSTWATGGNVAKESLLDIARAASAGGLPVEKTFDLITGLNGQFSDMGEMSRGLSATFAQFAQNLGPQKLGQAISAVQNLASGIANMSDETKAFIAMGSDSLGGGGTAIESIIRMEDAIASGDQDKLREIQEEMASKIEELSGGAMLTREEAVATGQEERFFTQAKLAEQLGASKGRTGYSAFVEGMSGNKQLDVGDLSALGDESRIVELEKQRGAAAISPTEALRRKAEGAQTRLRSGYADQAETHIFGPLKDTISNLDPTAQGIKSGLASMYGDFTTPLTAEEATSETVVAAGMGARTQEAFLSGNADSGSRAQTINTSGSGEISATSGISLTQKKGEISEYNQTSALAAQSLASSGDNLNAAATALTDAASQLSQTSSTPPQVTVNIVVNGSNDVARIRYEVEQGIKGALNGGSSAPRLNNSARPGPNL